MGGRGVGVCVLGCVLGCVPDWGREARLRGEQCGQPRRGGEGLGGGAAGAVERADLGGVWKTRLSGAGVGRSVPESSRRFRAAESRPE